MGFPGVWTVAMSNGALCTSVATDPDGTRTAPGSCRGRTRDQSRRVQRGFLDVGIDAQRHLAAVATASAKCLVK
jgi:hypothetical protein